MGKKFIDRRITQKTIIGEPKKVLISATGGVVYTTGSYKVHVFTSTGTFNIMYTGSANATFDCFLVAGGGSGVSGTNASSRTGGNGGSGGNCYYSYLIGASINTYFNKKTNYTVTVGGGGSESTIAYKSGTILTIGGPNAGSTQGGAGGSGEVLQVDGNGDPIAPDPEGVVGSNGTTAVITNPSIDLGFGPYAYYCGAGGGGGGAGGTPGGQGGREPITSNTSGDGGAGGDADINNAGTGYNGLVNSGDGGGGGGGGGASYYGSGYNGASGGSGGSGIVFIKYLYQQ